MDDALDNRHSTSSPILDGTPQSSPGSAAFDQLLRDYYQAWFHFHPEAAVEAGVDGYADRLTPFHDDDIGALVSLNENLLGALDELNAGELDTDRQLDFRLLHGAAVIELHELMEADWRYRDPARYLPVNAIYQLTVYPVRGLPQALQARLAAVPGHLRGARRILAETPQLVPAAWLEGAISEAVAGARFVRDLPIHPVLIRGFASLGRTAQLCEAAANAMEEFAHFLAQTIGARAEGAYACGHAHFARLLKHRHFLDCDAGALHDLGTRLVQRTRQELHAVTRRLRGDTDANAMASMIRSRHPTAGGLLNAYREQMQRAYEFVREQDLVEMPARQRLQVVDTPAFMRHAIPFAAYLPPAPNDPDQCGHYYVTPAADEELMGEHNDLALMHTCVHEAWPGHHLQFVTANQRPTSRTLPRLLNPSATLFEGWALYCEQLMFERGFLGQPEHEFLLLRDRLWRALRVQLDIELQTRGLGLDAAARRLSDTLGFPLAQAKADVLWYSRAPAVPMGYATGWSLINRSRERLVEDRDAQQMRSFHDGLLSAGSIAVPLVLERCHGAAFAQSVQRDVFGGGA